MNTLNLPIEPLRPIIQEFSEFFDMEPMLMMQATAKVQRELNIPVINNPDGNIASVYSIHVRRLTQGIYDYVESFKDYSAYGV